MKRHYQHTKKKTNKHKNILYKIIKYASFNIFLTLFFFSLCFVCISFVSVWATAPVSPTCNIFRDVQLLLQQQQRRESHCPRRHPVRPINKARRPMALLGRQRHRLEPVHNRRLLHSSMISTRPIAFPATWSICIHCSMLLLPAARTAQRYMVSLVDRSVHTTAQHSISRCMDKSKQILGISVECIIYIFVCLLLFIFFGWLQFPGVVLPTNYCCHNVAIQHSNKYIFQ